MREFLLDLRIRFIPIGSRRERIYHLIRLFFYKWRREGFLAALLNVNQRARFYLSKEFSLSRSGYTYHHWILDNEPGRGELSQQRMDAANFSYKPVISIITPVFNPSPEVLKDTINSVITQTYPHWQLCFANGGSTLAGVKEVLDEFSRRDERILVKHLHENLGIANNTNTALRLAHGEYIALMDHDDLLAPDMLFEVVSLLNQHPDAEIIYFDEDKISADGRTRLEPWFKPSSWSPDLLLSTNYLMHSVILRSLVEELGGFDPEVDGAQDWDFSLRATRKKRNIYHIPKVFYHWRQVPGSAARDANAKPWAFEAQARCIERHLHELGEENAKVEFPSLGMIRVVWPPSDTKVSIIIPTKDKFEYLQACLQSILEQTEYKNYEILLIDTGSQEEPTLVFFEEITADPRVNLHIYPGRFNFHKVNNYGARIANGDILLFLNNDTEILEGTWLDDLVGWANRPGVGVVGAKLFYPNGSIQQAGIVMGVEGHGSHIFEKLPEHHYGPFGSPDWYRDYMAVTGACMIIPRKVFERLGGFDEDYQIGYGDIDFCLRAVEAGYRVVYTPFAKLLHHEGGTRGFSVPPSDVLKASLSMFAIVKEGDPYFNPNLSYQYRQPTIGNPRDPKREERILRIMNEFDLIDTPALELNPGTGEHLIENPVSVQPHDPTKKEIIFVSHELSLTGAPLILSKLAAYLIDHGYKITVLSPIPGPLEDTYQKIGAEVIINPMILRDSREILRYLGSCELVLANTILAWRAVCAAKALEKPCIWWVHESQFGVNYSEKYPSVIGAFPIADILVFPSQATADLYAEFTLVEKIEIIHTSLDITKLADDKYLTPIDRNHGKLILVNVASYEPRKGQDILVRSLDKLPGNIKVECYLIGRKLDWWFSRRLELLASRRKNVHVLGELPNEKVLSYIQAADVYILASRDEALPMSLLEAMYFSKGIIATKAGGITEIIDHGKNGLLIDIEDYMGLANYIAQLHDDRDFLSQMGRNAYEKLKKELSIDSFGSKWNTLISTLLESEKNKTGLIQ
jgi:GT2 family glycosyltransferase/glycosyltransferase involved in cell wall biosynthesis